MPDTWAQQPRWWQLCASRFKEGKAPQGVRCEGKKKGVRYSPAIVNVRKGGGAAAQIPLQPMEKSMVEQRKKI